MRKGFPHQSEPQGGLGRKNAGSFLRVLAVISQKTTPAVKCEGRGEISSGSYNFPSASVLFVRVSLNGFDFLVEINSEKTSKSLSGESCQ